ncbi:hypothetical protein Deba_2505 [Desulfarculus baarsii DSM 2075]|uniref:Uncharacterized protein n=1 Tax=Desulfarculus baarsii (strain ATCC 33931 / DSM 2075 / LMG 7858 / VKM B-1802 / 2st14) TaxID=644282 RepID=E1QJX2_DESB2|nr:hypothetical protein [Desulfarculus baarsii]ADK85865.1 hypothetical protein Deba_2505 [Desulfarculus baarsii DSM 2075]
MQNKKANSEFTLEELEQIFGTADPKILFYRDYCHDMKEDDGGGDKGPER